MAFKSAKKSKYGMKATTLISILSLQPWQWVGKPRYDLLLQLADDWDVSVRRNWRGKIDVEYLIYKLSIIAYHDIDDSSDGESVV